MLYTFTLALCLMNVLMLLVQHFHVKILTVLLGVTLVVMLTYVYSLLDSVVVFRNWMILVSFTLEWFYIKLNYLT
jgi:hypothetical protein